MAEKAAHEFEKIKSLKLNEKKEVEMETKWKMYL